MHLLYLNQWLDHRILLYEPPVDGLSTPETGLDGTLMPFSAKGPSIT